MSEIHDVVKRFARRQKGGISGVADRIGVNGNTLTHKLAEQAGHNLFATEVEGIALDAPNDPEIAQYFARLCSHVCIPVPVLPEVAGKDLAEHVARVGTEFGDVMRAVSQAIKDGRVSRRELAEFDRQYNELLAVGALLRSDLEMMMPAAPPQLKVAR